MKKTAIAAEDTSPARRSRRPSPAGAGARAARRRPRAAAARPSRRAAPTASTPASSRVWATAAGLEPRSAGTRDAAPLRRLAVRARLRADAPSRASSPRCARCSARCASTARSTQNVAELVPAPKRAAAPAARAAARRARGAARPHPGVDGARAARPRAARARLRQRAARRGARQPRRRRSSTSTPRRCASRARAARRGSCPVGEPALRAITRYLERGRAALVADRDEPALFLSKSGRRLQTSDVRRRLRVWARGRGAPGRRLAARAASLVRHAPARRRRRPARDPGAARAQQHLDDADLHARRVGAAAQRVIAPSHPRA